MKVTVEDDDGRVTKYQDGEVMLVEMRQKSLDQELLDLVMPYFRRRSANKEAALRVLAFIKSHVEEWE